MALGDLDGIIGVIERGLVGGWDSHPSHSGFLCLDCFKPPAVLTVLLRGFPISLCLGFNPFDDGWGDGQSTHDPDMASHCTASPSTAAHNLEAKRILPCN